MSAAIPEAFISILRSFGVDLSLRAQERLQAYHDLLATWNRRINLISRKDTARIVNYHFLDSLTAVPLIPENAAVADLGSGAGLPGIPVKIARDDIRMTLVEATRKKALFLDDVVHQLELERTTVVNARAEDLLRSGRPASGTGALIPDPRSLIPDRPSPGFDAILCRLLGPIDEVTRLAAPFLLPGGNIIFYKSDTVEEELRQAQPVLNRLHLRVREIRDYRFTTPEAFIRRLVVVTRSA